MVLSLFYTRPKKVDPEAFRQSLQSLDNGQVNNTPKPASPSRSAGIPEALSFDNILKGGTCPPMTVRDFMNYLVYVERGAENLQFYLWFTDYEKRFAEAQTADVLLAPEWTQAMEYETLAMIRRDQAEKLRSDPITAAAAEKIVNIGNPFDTPPPSSNCSDAGSVTTVWSGIPSTGQTTHASSLTAQAADVFRSTGVKLPFTIQPFREETNRIIATYIMDHSPRQLNLSSRENQASIHALSYTTHPSAFRLLFKAVDASLRQQAHPNFIRWSICNGNPARVFFARSLGAGLVLSGLVVALALTLGDLGRGYRALAAVSWVLGFATLIAAYKGMCIVLHGMHRRHIRPWELFVHADYIEEEHSDSKKSNASFDSFGSSNSYEDEPWIIKYEQRNLVRKIFDREAWIQEPALRQIQDTIFVQAVLLAVFMGGILTAVFVAVPGARLY